MAVGSKYPLKMPGFTGYPLKAADRDDWPLYWQGEKLAENYGPSYNYYGDDQIATGYQVKLPKCVRIFYDSAMPSPTANAYYEALAEYLWDNCGEANKITITSGGSSALLADRFVGRVTPNALGIFDTYNAEDIVGGKYMAIVLSFASNILGSSIYPDPAFGLPTNIVDEYNYYVLTYDKFEDIKILFVLEPRTSFAFPELRYDPAKEIVTGIGGMGYYSLIGASTALTDLGWEFVDTEQIVSGTNPIIPYSWFLTRVQDFFGVV